MIIGAHALIYTKDPDALRAYFRDVLGFPHVDAGDGWLIFALPPAELGIHPSDGETDHKLTLMCDDIETTMTELRARGVDFAHEARDQGYGLVTTINLPGGGTIGLYQPRHATALGLTH